MSEKLLFCRILLHNSLVAGFNLGVLELEDIMLKSLLQQNHQKILKIELFCRSGLMALCLPLRTRYSYTGCMRIFMFISVNIFFQYFTLTPKILQATAVAKYINQIAIILPQRSGILWLCPYPNPVQCFYSALYIIFFFIFLLLNAFYRHS